MREPGRSPAWASEVLSGVDSGRVWGSFAVGLRDGCLLALLASGVTCAEAARLTCGEVTVEAKSGQVFLTLQRGGWECRRRLSQLHSAHVWAWLSEIRGYGETRPLLTDAAGRRLTRAGVGAILARYRRGRRAA